MNLRQIEVFRAVMLHGGITDAARALHVTQPGVSRAIKHLELQLKVRLFERVKGRVLPTEQARALFEQVRQVYEGVQAVQTFAASLAEGARSTLRIVCSPSVGLDVVPHALARLRERMPALRFELEVLPSPALVDALVQGHADVGLCAAAVDHPMLRVRRLAQLRMVCVASPAFGLGVHTQVSAAHVAALPFVAFDRHTFQGRLVQHAFEGAGATFDPVVSVRFARTACALVAAGVGVAFVDELTAAHFAGRGLDCVPVKPVLKVPVSVVSALHRPIGTAAERFADYAHAELKRRLTGRGAAR